MLKDIWKKEISRRKFLKTTGLTVASASVLAGCSTEYINKERSYGSASEKSVDHRNYEYTYTPENVSKVFTTCYMCAVNCSAVAVKDENGILKRMEPNPIDPVSEGGLCARGNAGIAQVYDEERLKTPMRKVGENQWEEISWDQAFDIIYEELTRIKETYGPETLVALNRRGYYNGYYKAFVKAYGSPNGVLGQNSICDGGKRVAQQLAGGGAGYYCDYKNSKFIMLLGANQMEAPRYRLAMPKNILEAQANGAKLVVIDPRFNYSAAKADEYHRINTGMDGLLLMSMAHVVIRENLLDEDFIENHSVGFEEYKNEVTKPEYAPENVADRIGISAEDIERLAIEFGEADGAIADSSSGLSMNINGTNGHWQLFNLMAMTGNMLSEGGVVRRQSAKLKGPKFEENNVGDLESFWTQAGYVEYSNRIESGNRSIIPELILTPDRVPAGPLLEEDYVSVNNGNGMKAVMVYQTDPIGAQANSTKMIEAFKALEFGVVIDIYLNQTAEALPIGGVVLPEATYLERYAARTINAYTSAIALNNAAIEPQWDSKSAYWIFIKMGQRFGFKDFMNLDPDAEYEAMKDSVMNADQAGDTKADWNDLEEKGIWMLKDVDARNYHNYEKVFNNEKYFFAFVGDKIIEDHEMFMRASGTNIPLFLEPNPTTEEFPIRFMAGGKVLWHTQTATRNNKYLMQVFDENVIVKDTNYIVMNTEDAAERGIVSGDMTKVTSPINSVEAEALVTERVPKGYAHMTHGFGHRAPTTTLANGVGANPGDLVDNLRLDPHSNCFTAKSEIINIAKA